MKLISGNAFWPVRAGLPRVYPPLKSDIETRVVVLGAGISGALTAFRLLEAGIDCVVVDRREAVHGSSCGSTGLLLYDIDTPLVELRDQIGAERADAAYRASLEALLNLERLVKQEQLDCGFEKVRSLLFASDSGDNDLVRREAAARQELGIECEFVEGEAIRRVLATAPAAGLLSENAAQVDCYRLTHELLHRGTQRGLRVFDRTTVEKVEGSAEKGYTLRTDRGANIVCEHIVFATGYETMEHIKHPDVELVSTYAVVTEPVAETPGWDSRVHLWETSRPYIYIRRTEEGRVLIGGEDDSFKSPAARDAVMEKRIATLMERTSKLLPDAKLEAAYDWAGTFGETKDGLPRIGAFEEKPNEHYALGYGGNGITFSVIAAELLRDRILGEFNPKAETFPFLPNKKSWSLFG